MQVAPSGGQICNKCKWCHLVAKFGTNASCAIWWPNLELMQVEPPLAGEITQVLDAYPGSVVPLAMFQYIITFCNILLYFVMQRKCVKKLTCKAGKRKDKHGLLTFSRKFKPNRGRGFQTVI